MEPMNDQAERLANPFRAGASATTPTDERVDFELRELSGFEEEFVDRHRDVANVARLCNQVLARCLVAPGADHRQALEWVGSLLVAERDRMLLELRRKSLGERVMCEVRCPQCDSLNEVDFALSAIDADFEVIDAPVEVSLAQGLAAQLRLPTAADQEALFDEDGVTTEAEQRTWLLSRVLTSLGDEVGPFAPDVVRGLSIRARHALEDAIEEALPDFELAMGVTCVECGCEFSSPFELASFFLRS